ncbi:MAG: cob(I)yrinic acid a,c-diamide adenosyltransferase [Actinobacteria bacterium]|jgi:cob(I)alamin adenosyltransferase|nr:cob(I)yrinic acid a,c-diamide adenosyltransferase [Actinomycetota bacterium]
MVKLTKIYTRTGDEGLTGLSDFSRVRKTDPRIEAYADVDEANSAIGVAVALAQNEFDEETLHLLSQIQNDLFDLGADLSNPLNEFYEYEPLRVDAVWVDALEAAIDKYNSQLEKLDSFILPGGSGLAAGLHLARTVVRRAERATWHAIEEYGTEPAKKGHNNGGINVIAARYLNRLSDLLFVLARYANLKHGGDVKWVPAANRRTPPEKRRPEKD